MAFLDRNKIVSGQYFSLWHYVDFDMHFKNKLSNESLEKKLTMYERDCYPGGLGFCLWSG